MILKLFQDVRKDPDVLERMTCGRTKCSNIISNVLCPRKTERLSHVLQNSKFSVLIFPVEKNNSRRKKYTLFYIIIYFMFFRFHNALKRIFHTRLRGADLKSTISRC